MELEFFGNRDPQIIALNVTVDVDKVVNNNPKVNYYFNIFQKPDIFNPDNLNIIVDHNFEMDENDNFIIADHHLTETEFGIIYKSNSALMMENYDDIFTVINELYNKFDVIDVYMHADVDGLCSGLITQHMILNAIHQSKNSNPADDLSLALVLGNYGDIADDAKFLMGKFVNYKSDEELEVYDRKMSKYCSSIARFMKGVRTGIIEYHNNESNTELMSAFDLRLKPYGLLFTDLIDTAELMYQLLADLTIVNTKSILVFMNTLAQNFVINKFLTIYQEESESLINNYIDPVVPCMEMRIKFKEDKTENNYKLIVIDSPFDLGRSVIWKYNTSYNKMNIKSGGRMNKWYYKVTDWVNSGARTIDQVVDEKRNYICYNRILKKLSMNGTNAYNIANEIFGGGGHISVDDGNSLGSVIIEDENIFYDSFVIVDIF